MEYPVDFVLIRQGEGVIECSNDDIFSEDYVRKIYKSPGKYKVMTRRDCGDYKTTKKLRSFELRAYAAEDGPGDVMSSTPASDLIADKLENFEKKRAAGWPEDKKLVESSTLPKEMKIVRKAGSDELKVVTKEGENVMEGFTLDDLKLAKQKYGGTDKVVKKDLGDQDFIKYILVFLGGLVIGALGTFIVLNQKHQKEMAAMNQKIDAMSRQVQMMASPKRDFNTWIMGEYNRSLGGPE